MGRKEVGEGLRDIGKWREFRILEIRVSLKRK